MCTTGDSGEIIILSDDDDDDEETAFREPSVLIVEVEDTKKNTSGNHCLSNMKCVCVCRQTGGF